MSGRLSLSFLKENTFLAVLSHFPPPAANVLRGFSPPKRTVMPQNLTDNNKICPVPKNDFGLLAIGRYLGPSGIVDKRHKAIFRPTSDKGCIITPSDHRRGSYGLEKCLGI